MYYTTCPSPSGNITLASNGEHLTGLWLEGQKYFGGTKAVNSEAVKAMQVKKDLPLFLQTQQWLEAYFNGDQPATSALPLRPKGTPFQEAVWRILTEIPYGEVTTYGGIAKKMALLTQKTTMSAQAIGGAVGRNPISIIIPCHRVVASNGSLTGYSGGIQVKVQLLNLEGVDTSRFFIPTKGTAL